MTRTITSRIGFRDAEGRRVYVTKTAGRVIATLVREAWVNDNAVEVDDGRSQHDITSKVLCMGKEAALALVDNTYETDHLVDHDHGGPFRVEVAQAIQDYYADDE